MDDIKQNLNHNHGLRRLNQAAVIAVASLIALVSARDYAGGWNDGSRLATVESLVDRGTLAIDESIFVRSSGNTQGPNPYTPGDESLRQRGTQDKLLIAGHYYSDKSPLPAFWLAGWYSLLHHVGGLSARDQPRLFCYLMTVFSSGVASVISVWSVWRLAVRHGLPPATCLVLAASLGLATVALPYTRQVNNHILLLAAVSLLMLVVDRLARAPKSLALLAAAGTLAGLGYTFDLGLGPVLVLATALLVTYRTRSILALACFGLAAAPWLAAHHAVNYLTGGTFAPANSVVAYLDWPGSPFHAGNMTGGWAHRDLGHFLLYAAALLFGKHGWLNYNLPLFLLLPFAAVLRRRRPAELPELVFAMGFCGAAWLLYAALSNNYSGPCCSVRWFVPFLAPAYYMLVIGLRESAVVPRRLQCLSVCGACLACVLWWRGPWEGTVPHLLWPANVAALAIVVFRRPVPPQTSLIAEAGPRREAA